MKKLSIVLLLFCSVAYAAEPQVLRDYFDPKVIIKDKAAVYHGEMLQKHVDELSIGQQTPENAVITYRELETSPDKAVYAVTVAWDANAQDFYAFLVREKETWKISAIRSRYFPEVMYQMANMARMNSQNKTPEELMARGDQNMLLILKSDAELKEHLKAHLTELNKVVALLKEKNLAAAKEQAKAIFMAEIALQLPTEGKAVEIPAVRLESLGTLGYMYTPAGIKTPVLSPDHYLYVDKAAENWYVYKKIGN